MSDDNVNNNIPWTDLAKADPIADMRENGLRVQLGRPLTEFEQIMARAGLTDDPPADPPA